MVETPHGEYHPQATGTCGESCQQCLRVCPFSNVHGQDEESLGQARFAADAACTRDEILGWVRDTYAGGLADEAQRLAAPSGGLTTAVLCHLLESGEVDAAIVLHPLAERPWYRFCIAETSEQIRASRGSVYHTAPLDKVIAEVLSGPQRKYAVVALPCVAKALRLAQARWPALHRRIAYVLGLTCSGQRSLFFPELLMSLMGASAGLLRYRSKRYARTSRDYRAELQCGPSVRSVRMLGLCGYLWVNAVGRFKSCLFCDDVFAELADATFMDAWLPEYRPDRRGTNLVVSRNARLSAILESLFESGQCEGGRIAAEKVIQSQIGVVRQRREGLAARCLAAEQAWGYAPRKRTPPSTPSPDARQRRQALRDLAYFQAVRTALGRFHTARGAKGGWPARLRAWRLCAKVLWLASRYGLLARTWQAWKQAASQRAGADSPPRIAATARAVGDPVVRPGPDSPHSQEQPGQVEPQ